MSTTIRIPSSPFHNKLRAALILIPLLTTGCATGPMIAPDKTTYPRDVTQQTHVTMPITPFDFGASLKAKAGDQFKHQDVIAGRPSLEFDKTEVGDTAESEFGILSNANFGPDENSLRSRIPEAAHETCGEHYRVVYTKYYLGTEATSRFIGTTSPWLKVRIRCSLHISTKDDQLYNLLASSSQNIIETDFFDINQKNYTLSPSQLIAGLKATIKARGMTIVNEKKSGQSTVIITDQTNGGAISFAPYERLITVVSPHAGGSTVIFRLMTYNIDFEGRSDGTTPVRFVPLPRDEAYGRVEKFLGELEKNLGIH